MYEFWNKNKPARQRYYILSPTLQCSHRLVQFMSAIYYCDLRAAGGREIYRKTHDYYCLAN